MLCTSFPPVCPEPFRLFSG